MLRDRRSTERRAELLPALVPGSDRLAMGRADACDKAYSVENRLNAIVTPVGQMATFVRSNSVAEQTIATWTIPAGDALVAGWTYQLLGFGDVSTVLTPTLTMRLRITNPAGALLGAGPAAVTGSGINAVSIGVDAKVMLESIGVSGKFSL